MGKLTKTSVSSLAFSKHTTDSFAWLLDDEELSDITLVSDDLVHVKAHKIVLSASSPFFRQLIKVNPQVQTVFYISGLNHQMLKHLLSLVYRGKIDQEIENFDVFMKMVKDFQILEHLFKVNIVENQTISDESEYIFDTKIIKEDVTDLESEGDRVLSEQPSKNNYEYQKPLSAKRLIKLKKLTCGKCEHIANTSKRLRIHKLKHEVRHKCRFCNFEAEVQTHLKKHINDEHPGMKLIKAPVNLTCELCGFIAKRSIRLKNHINKVHADRYPCEECGRTFLTTDDLDIHITKTHKNMNLLVFCEECTYKTKYPSNLRKHHKEKHTDHVYMCDKCEDVTKSQTRIRVHKQSKHEGKRFLCDKCDYSAPYREGLSRHVMIKHEGKTYHCDFCDYRATTNGNLKIHVESKHNGKRYPCDKCDHQATQLGSLKVHQR